MLAKELNVPLIAMSQLSHAVDTWGSRCSRACPPVPIRPPLRRLHITSWLGCASVFALRCTLKMSRKAKTQIPLRLPQKTSTRKMCEQRLPRGHVLKIGATVGFNVDPVTVRRRAQAMERAGVQWLWIRLQGEWPN